MKTYLGLGTNLGDKTKNLKNAIDVLSKEVGEIIDHSSIYETPPWGFESNDSFYNAVILLETHLNENELLLKCQAIEKELGRIKTLSEGYESRIIDIDILLYEGVKIQTKSLTIPHLLIEQRAFVLKPLVELLKKNSNILYQYYFDALLNCKDKSSLKTLTNETLR